MRKRTFQTTVRCWWAEFCQGYNYVLDPHGFESRIRRAEQARFVTRPAMYQLPDGDFVVHPALELQLHARITAEQPPELRGYELSGGFSGRRLFVSAFAVQQPPPDGWQDVDVPRRPRMRP